jgi:hypothetical protein
MYFSHHDSVTPEVSVPATKYCSNSSFISLSGIQSSARNSLATMRSKVLSASSTARSRPICFALILELASLASRNLLIRPRW